jgi:hypothetical protein
VNPFGLIIIALGLLMVIIGVKGSQHNVVQSFTGAKSAADQAEGQPVTSSAPTAGTAPADTGEVSS